MRTDVDHGAKAAREARRHAAWWQGCLPAVLLAAMAPLAVHAQAIVDAADLACHSPPSPILGQPVTERFIDADCPSCWQSADAAPGLVLDWIVPAADDAALQPAAIGEAVERLNRLDLPRAPPDRTLVRRTPAMPSPVELRATVGTVPLGGYVAMQLIARAPARATAMQVQGYLALVERIPAGTEGTPVERWLVRTVIGPIPIGPQATREVRATRVPETAHAARLRAVAWAEDAHGRIVRVVRTLCRGD